MRCNTSRIIWTPPLSFRWSCRMAICGSCGMMVNGIPKLGCKTFLRDYLPGKMTIEPLNNFPIERDLVVDMSDFIEKLESIKPYIIPSEPRSLCDGEYTQTPADMAKYHQFSMLHQLRSLLRGLPAIWHQQEVHRSGGLALAYRYNADNRDSASRSG